MVMSDQVGSVSQVRQLQKNLLLFLVAIMASIALGEFVLRQLAPERIMHEPTLINNRLTYEPNQKKTFHYLEWNYEILINDDGFRNDLTISQTADRSMLALGDSFTEGYGVPLKDTFSKKLEAFLNSRGLSENVYNAGHSGTNPKHYRLVYLEKFRRSEKFEHVILGLYVGNDLLRDSDPTGGELNPGNAYGDSLSYRIKTFLAANSAIYSVANYAIKTNANLHYICRKLGGCTEVRPEDVYSSQYLARTVAPTAAFLVNFSKILHRDGRTLTIVVIPAREQVDDRLWPSVVAAYGPGIMQNRFRVGDEITSALRKAGIQVVDLARPMHEHYRSGGEPLYFTHDAHLNSAGHEWVGLRIFRALTENSD